MKDLSQWIKVNSGKTGSDFLESLVLEAVAPSDKRLPANEIDPKKDAESFLKSECHHDDGPTLRYYRGSYWRWIDNRWVEWADDEVRAVVARYLGDRYLKVTRTAISNVIEFVRALRILPSETAMPAWLDSRAGDSITFSNGVATLDDLIKEKPDCLREHSPMWFSEVVLPYEYQPDASCDRWLDMLSTNLEGDVERKELLQEYAGYSLTHSTDFHKMLMLTGEGGEGKSCALAGISGMLGEKNPSNGNGQAK